MNISFVLNASAALLALLFSSILALRIHHKFIHRFRISGLGLGLFVFSLVYDASYFGIIPFPGSYFFLFSVIPLFCVSVYIFIHIKTMKGTKFKNIENRWFLPILGVCAAAFLIGLLNGGIGLVWALALPYAVIFFTILGLETVPQYKNPEHQMLIDSVLDVIVILDEKGCISKINRRGYQLTGSAFPSYIGEGIESLFSHPDLSREGRNKWLSLFSARDKTAESKHVFTLETSLKTKYGELIPVDTRITPLPDFEGNPGGYLVSATDIRMTRQLIKEIADREYATRELALSESKFTQLFIFNPTGILIVDLATTKITNVNPAMEEILESASNLLIGKTLQNIGLEMREMPFAAFIEKITMEGSVSEFGASISVGNNRLKKCHLSAVSLEMKGVDYILLSVVDVTKYEVLTDALAKKQKVETVGLLAGGIAHDFNNILSVIIGHIGLAKMRISDLHARVPIEKAEQACLRAREITGQLLVFSRGGKPILSRCDVREIIMDSAILSACDSTVTCVYDLEKNLWPALADRIQLGQVISNLVGNAVEAMDKMGSIEIRGRNRDFTHVSPSRRPVTLDEKPLAAGPYVEISVQDYGSGITPEIRAKIFDPFFTTKSKGTGLGLSIVFSIVQNHSGTIVLDSRVGEGTTFSVLIPAVVPVDESNTSVPLPNKPEAKAGPSDKGKVLVLDDDSHVRESLSLMLTSFGYEVVRAEEGHKAAELYRRDYLAGSPFAFGILDLVIENGASGVDCAKEILDLDPNATLIVSSGYYDDPVLAHYREYGFKGSIPKPYSIDELESALSEMLV